MKIIVTALISTSVLVGFAVSDGAYARRDKHRKKHATYQRYYAPRNAEADSYSNTSQVQYDINKLPFGSKLWWEQYLRTSGGSSGGSDGGGGR